MNNFRISVIINCFNGEKYLGETIQSVIDQSYENWEIIFWDNQSTDRSAEIVNNFKDKRIKYYKASEYSTLGRARNLAMGKATGEWCAFLDCDDLWLPNKLKKQVDIIKNDKEDLGLIYGQMLVHGEDKVNPSDWSKRMLRYTKKTMMTSLPEGLIFEDLLKINFIPLLTAIFRRDLFDIIGGISDHLEIAEDYDLFLKLSCLSKVRAVQEVVALYRVHGGNISEDKQEQSFLEIIEIINRYLPSKSAVRALKVQHTIRAIQEIRNGHILGGINRFLRYGGVNSFFSVLLLKI